MLGSKDGFEIIVAVLSGVGTISVLSDRCIIEEKGRMMISRIGPKL